MPELQITLCQSCSTVQHCNMCPTGLKYCLKRGFELISRILDTVQVGQRLTNIPCTRSLEDISVYEAPNKVC